MCVAAVAAAGCGDYVRQGNGAAFATVARLEGAPGAEPTRFGGTVLSDVITLVKKQLDGGGTVRVPTVFNDLGRVTVTADMKDSTVTNPSALNAITFTRYRVTYIRADGRNTPGVDVPYGFDSGVTFTVVPGGSASIGFDLVRHVAKEEAPLVSLASNDDLITTIAQVTFYGKDHTGHDVTASGNIGITFGNFGDPD